MRCDMCVGDLLTHVCNVLLLDCQLTDSIDSGRIYKSR